MKHVQHMQHTALPACAMAEPIVWRAAAAVCTRTYPVQLAALWLCFPVRCCLAATSIAGFGAVMLKLHSDCRAPHASEHYPQHRGSTTLRTRNAAQSTAASPPLPSAHASPVLLVCLRFASHVGQLQQPRQRQQEQRHHKAQRQAPAGC